MSTYNLNSNKIYVGLDVDDNAFHGAAILPDGELKRFKSAPSSASLIKKLMAISANTENFIICYETCHLGFSLARDLQRKNFNCKVIASSMIPEIASNRIKTDRIDSEKLGIYLKQGLLTEVNQPNEKDECVKQLTRHRKFLVEQAKAAKIKLRSEGRLIGIKIPSASTWTRTHAKNLEKFIQDTVSPEYRYLFLQQIEYINNQYASIKAIENKIVEYSEDEDYKKKHDSLICLRGIKTLGAMSIIAELGDINRFNHPSKIVAYLGLAVREYSSGGKERKFGITKTGNKRLRTLLVEANQVVPKSPNANTAIQRRRKGASDQAIQVAKNWDRRVYNKANRLINREKNKNKVKVACAREQIGFIWEILKAC